MITWSDIPLGWSIIAEYGADRRVRGFSVRRRFHAPFQNYDDDEWTAATIRGKLLKNSPRWSIAETVKRLESLPSS